MHFGCPQYKQKGFAPIIILVGILVIVAVAGGAYYFSKSQSVKPETTSSPNPALTSQTPQPSAVSQTIPSPTTLSSNLDTASWKTYSYKNISFQYPNDWVVIFDSKVYGQPNGFSLHIQNQNAAGYQPDELLISTSDDRKDLNNNNGYILSQDRKFTQTNTNDSFIQFNMSGTPIYSGCAFYNKHELTLEVCNKILSTFKFTQ